MNNYSFEKLFPLQQVQSILAQSNPDYAETVVFRLTVGCVKLEAAVFFFDGVSILGYDIFVKAQPEDTDWIAYDTLTQPTALDVPDIEQEMRRVLENYVRENGLSFAENHFKEVKKKEPMKDEQKHRDHNQGDD